jgi:hypothetical protein
MLRLFTHIVPFRDIHVVSSTELNCPIWNRLSLCIPSAMWLAKSILFKSSFDSHRETMSCMILLLAQIFFWGVHVFLQVSWICEFGTCTAYLHVDTLSCRFIPFKTNSIVTAKNVLVALVSNIDSFLLIFTFVSSTVLNSPICDKMNLSTPWNSDLEESSFQILTQFSQQNNVPDAPASNTACFVLRCSCVFSTLLKRSNQNKMILIHPENSDLQEYSIQKVTQISLVINVLCTSVLGPDCSLSQILAIHHLMWTGLFET